MNSWQIAGVLAGSAGGLWVLGNGLYKWGLRRWDELHERWVTHRQDKLTLEHIATRNKLHDTREVYPDGHGRFPLVRNTSGRWMDANTMRQFTLETVLSTWPALEKLDSIARIVLAAGGWPTSATAQAMLPEEGEPVVTWPDFPLLPELNRRGASLNSLIIGKTQDGTSIRRSLHELMHTLTVGVTGKGKTTWLLALLAQLAMATEPVEVIAIDTRGAGFNVLNGWGKLRYPLACTDSEAVALLNEVRQEIRRRRDLYKRYPIVDKLPVYNQVADEPLTPWVCVVDEGTQLLGEKDVASPLRECVQTGRQYGVYVLASGQTAKHTTISTEIRDNFVTRLCFRTSPTSTRVVLGENPPHPIDNEPGMAWAQLDGDNEFVEMRGPVIERDQFLRLLHNGGPKYQMPLTPDGNGDGLDVDQADDPSLPDGERARRLYDVGLSKRQIALRVYGGDGGAAWRKMEEAINGSSSTVEVVEPGDRDGEIGEHSTTTTGEG